MSLNVQRVKIVQYRTRRTLVASGVRQLPQLVLAPRTPSILKPTSESSRRRFRQRCQEVWQDVHNCYTRVEQLLMGSETCATLCLCRPLSVGATGDRVHKTLRSCSVRLCRTRFVGPHVVPKATDVWSVVSNSSSNASPSSSRSSWVLAGLAPTHR